MFRRDCFRDIGGYTASPAGGVDWIAVMTARLKGWRTRSFSTRRFHHHRSMGTAEKSPVAALFSYGQKDYYLGGSPVWQCFRVTYRLAKRPFCWADWRCWPATSGRRCAGSSGRSRMN